MKMRMFEEYSKKILRTNLNWAMKSVFCQIQVRKRKYMCVRERGSVFGHIKDERERERERKREGERERERERELTDIFGGRGT
jgi:hypothetical protein